jgi:hypothetical protein
VLSVEASSECEIFEENHGGRVFYGEKVLKTRKVFSTGFLLSIAKCKHGLVHPKKVAGKKGREEK